MRMIRVTPFLFDIIKLGSHSKVNRVRIARRNRWQCPQNCKSTVFQKETDRIGRNACKNAGSWHQIDSATGFEPNKMQIYIYFLCGELTCSQTCTIAGFPEIKKLESAPVA
jgi:hypothetical protein